MLFFFFFFLMIRRPPRSTHCISSAASDVYKRQVSTQSTWGIIIKQKKTKYKQKQKGQKKRMVVRTDLCSFCDWKIYPGHGQRYVLKDGKTFMFLHPKSKSLHMRKRKAQTIRWTISWRRLNKKIRADEQAKKKKKRIVRVQRAIVGITLDDIRKKRKENPEDRKARAEEVQRQIKERKQKLQEKKKVDQKEIKKRLKGCQKK
eukprot:TRINITY_DN268_c0_g1_i6.p1 TRINITY_DN268_c0_g1~~TRINITY_DN268_c0_g1_i6.p1  ORF type:complete len:203 (-),score=71.09 TRINITY_DN268_c0_g1_i6:146-754(-)